MNHLQISAIMVNPNQAKVNTFDDLVNKPNVHKDATITWLSLDAPVSEIQPKQGAVFKSALHFKCYRHDFGISIYICIDTILLLLL